MVTSPPIYQWPRSFGYQTSTIRLFVTAHIAKTSTRRLFVTPLVPFERWRPAACCPASAVLACCRTSRSRSGRRTCANGAARSLSTCGQKVRSAGCWYIACTAMAGGRALVRCQLRRDAVIAASLFGAWLHGKAALDRFSITWFKGPVAWPPLHLMHAASGSGVVLCCFGRVLVQDEGANPSNERLAARLYRACGPDTAEKSVTRVILKPATPLLLSCP